jgi:NAD(P)-dependent dehydrogenase (short-subunit alcohol dehydrogenase family)
VPRRYTVRNYQLLSPLSPPPNPIRSTACDKGTTESYTPLITTLSTTYPNTKVIPYPFNVTAEDETLVLIDEILANYGRLDIWVCSSGLLGPASIEETTPSDLQRCFEANSMAPFFALKYAPKAMGKLCLGKREYPNSSEKGTAYGSIIVVGSVAGTYGGEYMKENLEERRMRGV